jgi:predicted nuclease of restriction endonuclease-like (RecB) superfamily
LISSAEPYSEKDLENALVGHPADFLLEPGHGLSFAGRQKRLQIGTESYYLDLLFYHRGLRCPVAIDREIEAERRRIEERMLPQRKGIR